MVNTKAVAPKGLLKDFPTHYAILMVPLNRRKGKDLAVAVWFDAGFSQEATEENIIKLRRCLEKRFGESLVDIFPGTDMNILIQCSSYAATREALDNHAAATEQAIRDTFVGIETFRQRLPRKQIEKQMRTQMRP